MGVTKWGMIEGMEMGIERKCVGLGGHERDGGTKFQKVFRRDLFEGSPL